jgi:hypothetical protein
MAAVNQYRLIFASKWDFSRKLAIAGRDCHGLTRWDGPRPMLATTAFHAERTFTNIHRWTAMDRGGQFAAMERPEAPAVEIREFFRPLRRR